MVDCSWFMVRQSSIINHQSSINNHQSTIINHQSTIINQQSSINNHQSTIINQQSSIITMSSNNIFDVIQQGFKTVVGATASTIETLQDSQKREKTLSDVKEQWEKYSQEWIEKGEITEKQAREMFDKWLQKESKNQSSSTPTTIDTTAEEVPVSVSSNINKDIKSLTQAIIDLRMELEKVTSVQN
jgi:polyhydroxyalkanoate synthesis regulator phasin